MAEFNLPKGCGIFEYWTVKKSNIKTSLVKFQTLGVWFIVTRAYMLVKFGMDTEQIVTNTTIYFGSIHS